MNRNKNSKSTLIFKKNAWSSKKIKINVKKYRTFITKSFSLHRFESTTYPKLGEFITSVMGKAADKHQCWWFRDGDTGEKVQLGASSYVPRDNGKFLFQFGTYDPNEHC